MTNERIIFNEVCTHYDALQRHDLVSRFYTAEQVERYTAGLKFEPDGNGWPSFAIRSRTACKIYPCMLCPDAFAAAFIAFASGVNGFRFICVHFALYLSLFSLFLADTAIILPLFIFIYKI